MKLNLRNSSWAAVLGLFGLALGGCSLGDPVDTTTSQPLPPPVNFSLPELYKDVQAGAPGIEITPAQATQALAGGMPFLIRTDPFALLRQESAFEASQRAERLTEDLGWVTMYTPPAPPPSIPPALQMEPQPYRRLSGILIGDSVLAIMEFEDGTSLIVRPGTKIPNTQWTVVSLDADKAVLRRPGNARPTQIVVRLENPRIGGGGTGGGGGGGGTTGGGGGTAGGGLLGGGG